VIVGVGGSPGALSPLRELFAVLPSDCNLALVVVSHRAPSDKSLLPEILSKSTQMPVCEIADQTRAEPNDVYVAPRGHTVGIRGGLLFVLSGTGTDGTLGLAAIRAEGGRFRVQAPETAEFEGMPLSAIAAQAADFVLAQRAAAAQPRPNAPGDGHEVGRERARILHARRESALGEVG